MHEVDTAHRHLAVMAKKTSSEIVSACKVEGRLMELARMLAHTSHLVADGHNILLRLIHMSDLQLTRASLIGADMPPFPVYTYDPPSRRILATLNDGDTQSRHLLLGLVMMVALELKAQEEPFASWRS